MILDYFDYYAPDSLDEAVALLAKPTRPASILAGGTWLVPDMTAGKVRPRQVIDLRRASLAYVEDMKGSIRIGATTSYTQLRTSPLLGSRLGLLSTMAEAITGGAQITNRGTIGGSACAARPSSDVPACLVALQARMRLVSDSGVREVRAEDFFVDASRTVLTAHEVLSEIVVDAVPTATRFGFYKLKLCESSWPIVTGVCLFGLDSNGSCAALQLAIGGATAKPLFLDISSAVKGASAAREIASVVMESVRAAVSTPWADELADGTYRKKVAGVVAKRALFAAASQEEGGAGRCGSMSSCG